MRRDPKQLPLAPPRMFKSVFHVANSSGLIIFWVQGDDSWLPTSVSSHWYCLVGQIPTKLCDGCSHWDFHPCHCCLLPLLEGWILNCLALAAGIKDLWTGAGTSKAHCKVSISQKWSVTNKSDADVEWYGCKGATLFSTRTLTCHDLVCINVCCNHVHRHVCTDRTCNYCMCIFAHAGCIFGLTCLHCVGLTHWHECIFASNIQQTPDKLLAQGGASKSPTLLVFYLFFTMNSTMQNPEHSHSDENPTSNILPC